MPVIKLSRKKSANVTLIPVSTRSHYTSRMTNKPLEIISSIIRPYNKKSSFSKRKSKSINHNTVKDLPKLEIPELETQIFKCTVQKRFVVEPIIIVKDKAEPKKPDKISKQIALIDIPSPVLPPKYTKKEHRSRQVANYEFVQELI